MLFKKVDETGRFIEDVILAFHPQIEIEGEMKNDPLYRTESCIGGLYFPKFDFETKEWIEALTLEEINVIKSAPIEPTEIESLKTQLSEMEEALNFLIMKSQ